MFLITLQPDLHSRKKNMASGLSTGKYSSDLGSGSATSTYLPVKGAAHGWAQVPWGQMRLVTSINREDVSKNKKKSANIPFVGHE